MRADAERGEGDHPRTAPETASEDLRIAEVVHLDVPVQDGKVRSCSCISPNPVTHCAGRSGTIHAVENGDHALMAHQSSVCESLFRDFEFQPLRQANPPDRKGVYAIRVTRKGRDVKDILCEIDRLMEVLDWPILNTKIASRINRLSKIGDCRYIYIGSAGTSPTSRHTLRGRYKDFAGRHTAMFPLWALLYFGWELEYGWLPTDDSGAMERNLKSLYQNLHGGDLPALVHR